MAQLEHASEALNRVSMDCADYILTGGLVEAGRIAMGKVFATLLVGLMLTIGGGIVCAGLTARRNAFSSRECA